MEFWIGLGGGIIAYLLLARAVHWLCRQLDEHDW